MSQDITKTISGPMSINFGETPITVSPVNDTHVKLMGTITKSERVLGSGKILSHVTGRKLAFEISIDEVVSSAMDLIEAKKGELVAITQLDHDTLDLITIDDVEELNTELTENSCKISGFVSGDAESGWADLFAITTTPD